MTGGSGQYYGERLLRVLLIPWIQETMPSSRHPPGACGGGRRCCGVSQISRVPRLSRPVSAGVSTSGRGGWLLQQSADTAALQRVNTLTFSRPDTQHRHRGHTFTRNCRSCHGGGEGNITRSLRRFCCILLTKKYQSFKKCEFWSSRARHSPALAYQQTGQWRATLEIELAPAINTAPTTSSPTLH